MDEPSPTSEQGIPAFASFRSPARAVRRSSGADAVNSRTRSAVEMAHADRLREAATGCSATPSAHWHGRTIFPATPAATGQRVRHSSDMNLDKVADELYGLSLEEFTVTRNERAKEARRDGDRLLADQIRSLSKPTNAAWLVNQLVRSHADEVELLLELGRELRDVLADVDGDELRELTQQRYRLVSALVQQTRSLGHARGHRVTDDVAQAVRTTLEATLADESSADALAAGRLTAALEVSSGFGVGDEEGRPREPPAAPAPPSATVTDLDTQRQRRARQQAAQAVEAAERNAERSRSSAERAAEQLRPAQQRTQEASATVDELRQQLEHAVAALQQREEQERVAIEDGQQAHRQADEADDELADARARLTDLES